MLAGFDPTEPEYLQLISKVETLLRKYPDEPPPRGPGRRNEQPPKALVKGLARIFHDRSAWECSSLHEQDEPDDLRADYWKALVQFVVRLLTRKRIFPPTTRPDTFFRKTIPAKWRVPR